MFFYRSLKAIKEGFQLRRFSREASGWSYQSKLEWWLLSTLISKQGADYSWDRLKFDAMELPQLLE